jgi:DNA-binding transcriptional MerR regulator
MSQTYRVREFAERAGITVRALHHYDRVGLLAPRRTSAGYRVYVDADLAVLEQIVALKFLGFSLRDIKAVLRKNPAEIADVLRAQRLLLVEQRGRMDEAIRVIAEAERRLRLSEPGDMTVMATIIEVLTMENQKMDAEQYTVLLDRKIQVLKTMSAEQRTQLYEQCAALGREIEAALNQDPAGPVAQALAERWVSMLAVFNQGEAVPRDLVRAEAARFDASTFPSSAGPFANPAVWAFIEKALGKSHITNR